MNTSIKYLTNKIKTPIVVIIYNRSDKARNILNLIERVQPEHLYVLADGAKDEIDRVKVQKTRDVFNNISWKCNVKRLYADDNLGLRNRVVSGLNYVFSIEEKAIILEDDIVPDITFFYFADELLEKYEKQSNVFSICGTNFFPNDSIGDSKSYFFSRYTNSWGWATWRRAWNLYCDDITKLDILTKNGFFKYGLRGLRSQLYWKYIFNALKKGRMDSWAYRWMMTNWLYNGINIVPKHNLIVNGGVGNNATHTKTTRFYLKNCLGKIDFPLIHASFLTNNYRYDTKCENLIYSKSLYGRIKWLIEKLFKL